mgnify:CR=1 FL=1
MTAEYDALIDEAAPRLEKVMREAAAQGRSGEVTVWAVFTTPEADGYLHAGIDYPEGVPIGGYSVVRPASGATWGMTPYSAYRSALWHACRHEPIMPIPRAA